MLLMWILKLMCNVGCTYLIINSFIVFDRKSSSRLRCMFVLSCENSIVHIYIQPEQRRYFKEILITIKGMQ